MSFWCRLWQTITTGFTFLRRLPALLKGTWKVKQFSQPIVTIFGGSRIAHDSDYALAAHDLAKALVKHDIAVLNGGGSGIMQAASCGVIDAEESKAANGLSIGFFGIEGIPNPCVSDLVMTDYFPIRKFLLMEFSSGFAVFPGGLGTLDEASEVLMLMQIEKLPTSPVVFIGKKFWSKVFEWIAVAQKEGVVHSPDNMEMYCTDDIVQAAQILCKHCKKIRGKKIRAPR